MISASLNQWLDSRFPLSALSDPWHMFLKQNQDFLVCNILGTMVRSALKTILTVLCTFYQSMSLVTFKVKLLKLTTKHHFKFEYWITTWLNLGLQRFFDFNAIKFWLLPFDFFYSIHWQNVEQEWRQNSKFILRVWCKKKFLYKIR